MKPLAVAFGGGVNSTAMLVEMHRRGTYPDLILFADTGGERPETYAAVNRVSQWCMENFGIGIITVKKTFKGSPETLEANCLRMTMLPSIAYGYKACSMKYKTDPQNKFVNNWPPARAAWKSKGKVTKAIGYDAGEERRATIKDDNKYKYWHPLIEWGIYREQCVEICESEGLPTAKSSCWFCPSMRKWEIIQLVKQHPDLAKRAVEMEDNANLTSVKGLGRSFSWKDLMATDASQIKMFEDYGAPEIPCGCYDG